jgi:hypothetical protein
VYFIFIKSANLYYNLFYTFLLIVLVTILLCFFQLDLFAAFFIVSELTVIFVFLLLFFYLNFKGLLVRSHMGTRYWFLLMFFCVYILYFDVYMGGSDYFTAFYDDFYEAFNNNQLNDFTGLFYSYYLFNSIAFIFLMLILLIISMVAIILYQKNDEVKLININKYLTFYNFFKDAIKLNFLKKQNLMQFKPINLKIFKKKL